MEKDKLSIIEKIDNMLVNSDFLDSEKNRTDLKTILTGWNVLINMKCDEVDRERADKEIAKLQPQLDAITNIFDTISNIIFDADFKNSKVTSSTVSGRFSSKKPNMEEIKKPIFEDTIEEPEEWFISHFYPDINEICEALRALAKKENQ